MQGWHGNWILKGQEGYFSSKKLGKGNSLRKDIKSWMGMECPLKMNRLQFTMCDDSVPFSLQLLGVSLHTADEMRRLRLREIERRSQEQVVKLSPSFLSILYCLSHLPCCTTRF